MGVNQDHGLGHQRRIFAVPEPAYRSIGRPASQHALKVLDFSIDFKQGRKNRDDNRQTLSQVERITQKKEGSWSMEGYAQPSGFLGVPPAIANVLRSATGDETINPGRSVTYTLNRGQAGLGSLTFAHEMNELVLETCFGAWVNEWKLTLTGGEEPKLGFSGGFSDQIHTGSSTLLVPVANGDQIIEVVTPPGALVSDFERNSIVRVGGSLGAGAGHVVRRITGGLIEVDPPINGNQLAGAPVRAWVPPEPTNVPRVIAGILGAFTIDGREAPITQLEVIINNNIQPHRDVAFQDAVVDYTRNRRIVTGTVKFRAQRDQVIRLRERKAFDAHDILAQCGIQPGSILEVSIPMAEFEFAAMETPTEGEAIITLPFIALGTWVGEDEIVITWR